MKLFTYEDFTKNYLQTFQSRGKQDLENLRDYAEQIILKVKEEGDKALIEFAKQFDNTDFEESSIVVTSEEIDEAYTKINDKQLRAIEFAAENITKFHQEQLVTDWEISSISGVTLGQLIKPISVVGIYVPGGFTAYSSSVLMCSIPAKLANVNRIQLCTPVQGKDPTSPMLLVAADIAAVDAIYKVGGIHAIAALGYGTETIPKADKIVGPGNKYVTAAKMVVSNNLAIDLPAGPSEILVIADETANPCFIAADLIAQAEHDLNSISILITDSEEIQTKVLAEIKAQLRRLERNKSIAKTLKANGFIIKVESLEQAIKLANEIAPEHLAIQTADPKQFLDRIQNAGAIFLGNKTPVAFGDYTAGINHVLPTAGFAKSYSGLSVRDFYKTINFMNCTDNGFDSLQEETVTFAQMENLEAHANSVLVRTRGN